MATNATNITKSATEEKELEISLEEWSQPKGFPSIGYSWELSEEELKDTYHVPKYVLNLDIMWEISPKQSKMEPYLTLDNLNDDLGTLTTQTTKRPGGGINTNYTEQLLCDIPQGTRELYVRLRNRKRLIFDDLITSKRIRLDKLRSNGYDKIMWKFSHKDGSRGIATLVLREYSPEGSTAIQNDSSYIGCKNGDAFGCTKH